MIGHRCWVQAGDCSGAGTIRERLALTQGDGEHLRAWSVQLDAPWCSAPLPVLDTCIFSLDGIDEARVVPGGWA